MLYSLVPWTISPPLTASTTCQRPFLMAASPSASDVQRSSLLVSVGAQIGTSQPRPLTDLLLPCTPRLNGTTSYLAIILVNPAFYGLFSLMLNVLVVNKSPMICLLVTAHPHTLALASNLDHHDSPYRWTVFRPLPFGPCVACPSSGSSLLPLRQSPSFLVWDLVYFPASPPDMCHPACSPITLSYL